jgi:hypothetical protein
MSAVLLPKSSFPLSINPLDRPRREVEAQICVYPMPQIRLPQSSLSHTTRYLPHTRHLSIRVSSICSSRLRRSAGQTRSRFAFTYTHTHSLPRSCQAANPVVVVFSLQGTMVCFRPGPSPRAAALRALRIPQQHIRHDLAHPRESNRHL